jgi:hypothetical protein
MPTGSDSDPHPNDKGVATMTIESLTRAYTAQPFRPFMFRLADGREIPVRHPEFLSFNPRTGRTAIVMDENEGWDVVDLLLVVSLRFEGEPAASGR